MESEFLTSNTEGGRQRVEVLRKRGGMLWIGTGSGGVFNILLEDLLLEVMKINYKSHAGSMYRVERLNFCNRTCEHGNSCFVFP